MSSKRSMRPWQSGAALSPIASASRSDCSSARGTPSAFAPGAQSIPPKDTDGGPKDVRPARKTPGNELRRLDGEGTVDERRRTATVQDPSRVTLPAPLTAVMTSGFGCAQVTMPAAAGLEIPISRAEVRSDAMRNAEGLQTILCAQLLSSLAKGNAAQNVTAPWHKEMTDDTVAVRAKIYDDPEVNDFTCRLINFSKSTGITPPVILSYVVNESSIHSAPGNSKEAPVVQVDEDGQLNHVLFDLLWRQHTADDSALTGVASNRGAAISTPSSEDVTRKHRQHDDCGELKRTTRQEAKQRWLKKRENRSFSAKIRYPARQHLANARKRHKGQFVSNKDTKTIATEEDIL